MNLELQMLQMSLCNVNNNVWAPLEADEDSATQWPTPPFDYMIVQKLTLVVEVWAFCLPVVQHCSFWPLQAVHGATYVVIKFFEEWNQKNYVAESTGPWISSIPCMELLVSELYWGTFAQPHYMGMGLLHIVQRHLGYRYNVDWHKNARRKWTVISTEKLGWLPKTAH